MGCGKSKSGARSFKAAEQKIGERTFISFDGRMKAEWKNADRNGDNALSFKEVKRLIKKLNLAIPDRQLKKEFQKYDTDGNKELSFDEFQKLFQAVQSLPDVRQVFEKAAANQKAMVAEELVRFITSSSFGKVFMSTEEAARLILKYEGATAEEIEKCIEENSQNEEEAFLDGPLLTYEGFQRMMTDPAVNSAANQKHMTKVYQDMTHPLSHYFISSSHNSYLSGNQLNSDSKPEAIAKALRLGVRVIELDAWDGSDGNPIVNHGHTMCTPCKFKDCLETIMEEGFKASDYPVIITIENHCSLPQQKKQIEMIKKTFAERLYFWDGVKGEDGKNDWKVGPPDWASPEDLKGMVIIRDKPIKKKKHGKKNGADGVTSPSSATTPPTPPPNPTPSSRELSPDEITTQGSIDLDDDEEDDVEAASEIGCDDELLRCMYIKNVKMHVHVDKSGKKVTYTDPPFSSSSSIVEAKMMKLTKPGYHVRDLAAYAYRHLVRVYPAGSRVDSSNYDPVVAWNAGCQIVALNYQTNTMPLWLNQGKFSDNGGCGYILKPDFLLPPNATSPKPWTGEPTDVVMELTVTVISGHYLPKPLGKSERSEVIDPFVEVSMYGMEADYQKNTTKHIDDNGFNPTWNEKFTYKIHEPELAMLSFVVHDHDVIGKDFIGQRVIPVKSLVPGYRMVELNFANGAPEDAYLFVHLQFSPSPP